MRLPLCVVTDPEGQTGSDGSRCYGGFYIREILAHAGIPFDEMERPLVALEGFRVVLLPWHLQLSEAERTLLAGFVESGGALIGLGGMSGLDDVFGAVDRGGMADGYLQVTAKDHPGNGGIQKQSALFWRAANQSRERHGAGEGDGRERRGG